MTLDDNLFTLLRVDEMCTVCRRGTESGSGEYPVRAEGEAIPDPNDGALCRRCAVKLRTD